MMMEVATVAFSRSSDCFLNPSIHEHSGNESLGLTAMVVLGCGGGHMYLGEVI